MCFHDVPPIRLALEGLIFTDSPLLFQDFGRPFILYDSTNFRPVFRLLLMFRVQALPPSLLFSPSPFVFSRPSPVFLSQRPQMVSPHPPSINASFLQRTVTVTPLAYGS